MIAAPCSSLRSTAVVLLACAACAGPAADAPAETGAAADAAPAASAATVVAAWTGPYALRGAIEGNRPVSGTLTLTPLATGAPEYAAASAEVRRTYPDYAGPFYGARMALAAGADTLDGAFHCAHSPATPPALVCHPTAPLKGLAAATLVMQPNGRAVLGGSHAEGVSVEFGRFSWTAQGS